MSSPQDQKQEKAQEQSIANEVLVHAALDEKVANLNELTKAKLASARLNALERGQQSRSWLQRVRENYAMTGALATSFSVLAVMVLMFNSAEVSLEPTLNEQQVLMAMMNPVLNEDPEMLEQLEFIAWLELEPDDQKGQG